MRVLWDEIQTFDGVLGFVNSGDEASGPDSKTTIMRMREWHWWSSFSSFIVSIENFFNFFDLFLEKFVNHLGCSLVNKVFDEWSLCKRIKVLEHFDTI